MENFGAFSGREARGYGAPDDTPGRFSWPARQVVADVPERLPQAWDVAFDGDTATCVNCYVEWGDASRGVSAPAPLSATLTGNSASLYAELDTATDAGALALVTEKGQGWPQEDTTKVWFRLYAVAKDSAPESPWRVVCDFRAAPRPPLYR